MLSEDDIVDIDSTLRVCGANSLSKSELVYLEAIGASIDTSCDKYTLSQDVLLVRGKSSNISGELMRLEKLSEVNGCPLVDKEPDKPTATIPVFGFGVSNDHD